MSRTMSLATSHPMGGSSGQLSCRTKAVLTAPTLGFYALRYVKLGYMKKHLDQRGECGWVMDLRWGWVTWDGPVHLWWFLVIWWHMGHMGLYVPWWYDVDHDTGIVSCHPRSGPGPDWRRAGWREWRSTFIRHWPRLVCRMWALDGFGNAKHVGFFPRAPAKGSS